MSELVVNLTGRRALITGGGRGIGRAIAVALARCGAEVAINYLADVESAEQAVAEAGHVGGKAFSIQADVSRSDEVDRLFSELRQRFDNRLDILVNNAGGVQRFTLEEMPEKAWDECFAVNVKSVFLCTQAALPMLPDGTGRIINVTSISARIGGAANSTHYAAAKGAVSTFTRSCARALSQRRITVNGVAPGVIHTDFHKRGTPEPVLRDLLSKIPLGRLGTAEECAGAVLMLCSSHASYITGEIIEINGGLLMD